MVKYYSLEREPSTDERVLMGERGELVRVVT